MISLLAVSATRADQRLADARAATRTAERVLLSIQTATTPPSLDPATPVTVQRLDNQPGPRAWIRVTATVNNRSSTLLGLVPTPAADAAVSTYGGPHP